MSKYYHIFNTEDDYNNEKQTFDGPHVVFIKSIKSTRKKHSKIHSFNSSISRNKNARDYAQIEYIENTSNAFIDTGYIPNANARISMKIYSYGTAGDGYHGIYDSRGGGLNTGITFFPVNGVFALNWGAGVQYTNVPFSENTLYEIEVSSGKLKVNDVETKFTSGTNFTKPVSLKLFKNVGSESRNWHGRIYSFKIYEGRKLVHNFIPVLKISTLRFGLYDTKTNTFFDSATAASFSGVLAWHAPNGYNYFYRYSNDKSTFTEASSSFVETVNDEMRCVDPGYRRNLLCGAANIDTYSAYTQITDRQNFIITFASNIEITPHENTEYTNSIDLSFSGLKNGTATSSKDAWFQTPVNEEWTTNYGTRIWTGWYLSKDTTASKSKRGTFDIRATGYVTMKSGPKGMGTVYSPQMRIDSLTGKIRWKNIKICEGHSSVYTPAPEDATFGHMPGTYFGTCKTLKTYASHNIKDYTFKKR